MTMKILYGAAPDDIKAYDTQRLRDAFRRTLCVRIQTLPMRWTPLAHCTLVIPRLLVRPGPAK